MKRALLEILICPRCLPAQEGLDVTVQGEEAGDIISGSLRCPSCRALYPIKEGIAFLDPAPDASGRPPSKYETQPVVSSYLWSHYGDIMDDPDAFPSYSQWASFIEGGRGIVLDIGAAVGRFTFEMSRSWDMAVGIDNSVAFVRAARGLMASGRMVAELREEGLLTSSRDIRLAGDWRPGRVEFVVADALALPFRAGVFAAVASLNIADKVPKPLRHLQEANRVARAQGAQFLFSDPFSWSEEAAPKEDWLGGLHEGPYAGRGLDNVAALLEGRGGFLQPPWVVEKKGHVWWKIRTHANHFELIRSRFVKARR